MNICDGMLVYVLLCVKDMVKYFWSAIIYSVMEDVRENFAVDEVGAIVAMRK